MITDFLLIIIRLILTGLAAPITLLDDVSVDSGVGGAITTAAQYIASWNTVLPLSTVLTCFALLLVIELGIAVYKLIMWAIRRLPTQS